jgi:predicted HicB family RNase H-like nuclease
MDVTSITARLETVLGHQVRLAGDDPAVEDAAAALLAALGPALRQAAYELAEQAAIEVGAQVPGYSVDVVLRDGEPALAVRAADATSSAAFTTDDLEARLTLRLPASLKGLIEESASESGDSVNSFVVKTLAGRAGQRRGRGQRIQGTVES